MVTEVAGRTTLAASFSMPGEGEPMIPVVFPARSTGIGIATGTFVAAALGPALIGVPRGLAIEPPAVGGAGG